MQAIWVQLWSEYSYELRTTMIWIQLWSESSYDLWSESSYELWSEYNYAQSTAMRWVQLWSEYISELNLQHLQANNLAQENTPRPSHETNKPWRMNESSWNIWSWNFWKRKLLIAGTRSEWDLTVHGPQKMVVLIEFHGFSHHDRSCLTLDKASISC